MLLGGECRDEPDAKVTKKIYHGQEIVFVSAIPGADSAEYTRGV